MIKQSWSNIPELKSETRGEQFEAYVINLPLIVSQGNFDYESWQSIASEIPCGIVVPYNNDNNYFYVDDYHNDEGTPVISIIPSNFITYNNYNAVSSEFYEVLKPFLEQDIVIKFTDRGQYIDYIKNTVLKYYNNLLE